MFILKGARRNRMSVKNNRLLKKLKRTTACWLTAAMVLSCFGTVAGAATGEDANDTSLYGEISVGKSAEWTNEDKYIGKVKLSVPGEEATKKIAVVFAVDKSNSTADAEFPAAAKKFVSDLGQKKKLDVKVGVVVGDSVAYDAIRETSDGQETGLLDITTGSSAIDRALDTPFKDYIKEGDRYIGGSNSQALVLKAEEILDGADTDTDKYIVLLTDMYTYIYNGNLTTADGNVHDNMPCSKDLGFTNASTKEQTADGAFLQQYNDSLTSPQTGSSEGGQHFTNVQFTSGKICIIPILMKKISLI